MRIKGFPPLGQAQINPTFKQRVKSNNLTPIFF